MQNKLNGTTIWMNKHICFMGKMKININSLEPFCREAQSFQIEVTHANVLLRLIYDLLLIFFLLLRKMVLMLAL